MTPNVITVNKTSARQKTAIPTYLPSSAPVGKVRFISASIHYQIGLLFLFAPYLNRHIVRSEGVFLYDDLPSSAASSASLAAATAATPLPSLLSLPGATPAASPTASPLHFSLPLPLPLPRLLLQMLLPTHCHYSCCFTYRLLSYITPLPSLHCLLLLHCFPGGVSTVGETPKQCRLLYTTSGLCGMGRPA